MSMRPAGVVVSIASVRLRKPALCLCDALHEMQEIFQGTRQPIEFPHDHNVPRPELVEQPV